MTKDNTKSGTPKKQPKNKSAVRRLFIIAAILIAIVIVTVTATLIYNNVSFTSDSDFEKQLDRSIENALAWTESNKQTILTRKNIALIKMLAEADRLHPTPLFSEIVDSFMSTPSRPRCWKGLVDPDWNVDKVELNITIKKEYLDNKWVLYAIAPDKAEVDPKELGLFDAEKWQHRKLTHQLDALLLLKRTKSEDTELDKLIEHLAGRLTTQLTTDIPVTDIYIQKATFILRAGHPEKIRKRWIERIIENQRADGGWDDRWFSFNSESKKPVFNSRGKETNQHATLQALTMLYLVKHRYPENFLLADSQTDTP